MDSHNYSEWPNFHNAVREAKPDFDFKTLRPLLWKDEVKDVFIITKTMEIYLYSRKVLNCYCWSKKTYSQLKKQKIIFHEWSTDDGIYTFRGDVRDLPLILALGGTFKRRPRVNGLWIKSKEKILGHQIIPFRPEIEIESKFEKREQETFLVGQEI